MTLPNSALPAGERLRPARTIRSASWSSATADGRPGIPAGAFERDVDSGVLEQFLRPTDRRDLRDERPFAVLFEVVYQRDVDRLGIEWQTREFGGLCSRACLVTVDADDDLVHTPR
nr:hypothetical protein [Halomicroarcula sp. XH51]